MNVTRVDQVSFQPYQIVIQIDNDLDRGCLRAVLQYKGSELTDGARKLHDLIVSAMRAE